MTETRASEPVPFDCVVAATVADLGGVDDAADIEQAESGDAVERGDEPGIAELRLVVFNGGLVDLDLCIELIDGGLLIVAQLAGGGILFDEFGVALEVESLHCGDAPGRDRG